MKRIFFLIIGLFLCVACRNWEKYSEGKTENQSADFHGTKNMEYAKGFAMSYSDSTVFILVKNPWSGNDTLATYLLIRKGNKEAYSGLADFVIKIPVARVTTLSSVYLGMFKLLGESERIIGSNNARLIYDSTLYNRYLRGNLIDLGESPEMDAEAVIGALPDLLMKYIYGSRDINDQRVVEAGIPIAYNLEFMETHPLGRAEWIKFVAAFIGKDEMADSIFNTIKTEYLRLSGLTMKVSDKPSVLDGSSYKGVWYAAGGKSFPTQFYTDAGADYFWKSDSSRGSIPLNFEVIIDKQADADYWIGPSSGSKKQLLDIEQRYSLLKSFRNNNVFYFGKRVNVNGGLDYYESGVTRPDILLRDLLWVFHPELLDSSYQPFYLEKLKD
jgi:iron complex transport system substrate-binding protein